MAHDAVAEVTCGACGGRVQIHEAKGGSLSTKCIDCGHQGFIRSPAGVAKVRARLNKPAADNPFALDITKL